MLNSILVLVTGGKGQMGQVLRVEAEAIAALQLITTGRDEVDICDAASIGQAIKHYQPQVIINCAAYTAVDKAETEPQLAYRLNRDAVATLAAQAAKHQITLLQLSTDYVFAGDQSKPYTERDTPAPQSVYGASKLAGEQALKQSACRGAIIRTSWLYSEFGSNFVKTMLKLAQNRNAIKVVADQFGSPTYARDLAAVLLQMASEHAQPYFNTPQVWHYANTGETSWYNFAKAIFEQSELACTVQPIQTAAWPALAKRPAYSVLATANMQQAFNLSIPPWRDSLNRCLARLANPAAT